MYLFNSKRKMSAIPKSVCHVNKNKKIKSVKIIDMVSLNSSFYIID